MRNRIRAIGVAALLAAAGTAHGQVVIGLENVAEQIRVYNSVTGTFEDFIPTGIEVTAMTADDAGRLIYYSDRTSLWRVPYDAPRTPVLIGNFAGAATQLFGGLAWVPSEGKLYGTNTTQLFEVSTTDASLTLIRTTTSADFGGLDFNAGDGKLYASNDATSTTAPLAGRGIYTIDPPFASGAITRIAAYPGSETDIDALAVGGGKVFLCTDQNNNRLYEYTIATNTYSSAITRPGGATTDRITSGAAYAAGLGVTPAGVNLGLQITDPADCTVPVNSPAGFTINVNNVGADQADNVVLTVTVPANATFNSSTPSGTLVGNTLTINLGSLAGNATSTSVSLSLTPTSGLTIDVSASVTSTQADTNPSNNTANSTAQLTPTLPATAAIKGVISNYAPSSSSDVPGQPGVKFATGLTPGVPVFSPDGRNWLQFWDTDQATTQDGVLVRSINGTISVAVQEGVTTLPNTAQPSTFVGVYGINNAGQYAFGGTDNGGVTTTDGFVVKWDGANLVEIAREGSAASAATFGTTWSGTRNAVQIATDGTVAFLHTVAGLTTTTDTFILKNDGNTVVAQEGVTSPGNQQGAGGLWQTFDSAGPGTGIYFNADHSTYIASGDTSAATTEDKFVVVNGNVVIQEGFPITGFTSNASAVNGLAIAPNATATSGWMAYGSNADTQDWVVRNGAVVAQTDAPIFAGSTENFDDAPFAGTFFMIGINNRGDYVVGGTTNSTNDRANAVIVLNNQTVLARENDPIDLNNNGAFDDGVYLSVFVDDRLTLTNDALFAVVRLRDQNAALCGGTITDIGQALIRIPLPPSCPADFNGVGGLTVQDIFDYLTAYFSADPRADFNGAGGITVQDIFDYLSAYFSGCP